MSQQERVSWVSLLVSLLVGGWYFGHVFGLRAADGLYGPALVNFVFDLIIVGIVVGIVSEILLRWATRAGRVTAKDGVRLDERDALIGLKAARNAYRVLAASVALLLWQVAWLELPAARLRHLQLPPSARVIDQIVAGPMTPLLIVQLLLLALTLAGISVYASRIFYYRRGA
jgi:hypothetical protein